MKKTYSDVTRVQLILLRKKSSLITTSKSHYEIDSFIFYWKNLGFKTKGNWISIRISGMRNYYLQGDYCPHFCQYYYNISATDIPRYG